jgi:hypothetical protein
MQQRPPRQRLSSNALGACDLGKGFRDSREIAFPLRERHRRTFWTSPGRFKWRNQVLYGCDASF